MRPAACCRAFTLSTPVTEITGDTHGPDGPLIVRLVESIGPHRVNPESGHDYDYDVDLYRCKALSVDGRCTVYETRPTMCRSFQCVGPRACLEYVGCPSLGAGCSGGDCRAAVVEEKRAEERS